MQIAFRIDKDEYDKALARANELGISFSRYVRRLIRHDLHLSDVESAKELAQINDEFRQKELRGE